MQMQEWFGGTPNFVITLDAQLANDMPDLEFCATIDHELYHAGHKKDPDGQPMFNIQTGLPAFYIRPHDVEEFSGVVRRYGIDVTRNGREFLEAANDNPLFDAETVEIKCGSCR